MGFQKPKSARPQEPAGFTLHSSGKASQRARQQGWQTDVEERTQEPEGKEGGTDYHYGAQDFGDVPEDTSSAQGPALNKWEIPKRGKKAGAAKKNAA